MTISINVRISGQLEEHIKEQVSENGLYDNISEYIRELIRKDLKEKDSSSFNNINHLSNYLKKLATSEEDNFVDISLENIVKKEYSKVKSL